MPYVVVVLVRCTDIHSQNFSNMQYVDMQENQLDGELAGWDFDKAWSDSC